MDHDNLQAFYLNDESEGPDNEFDYGQMDTEKKRFNNTDERYYSDIDPDL